MSCDGRLSERQLSLSVFATTITQSHRILINERGNITFSSSDPPRCPVFVRNNDQVRRLCLLLPGPESPQLRSLRAYVLRRRYTGGIGAIGRLRLQPHLRDGGYVRHERGWGGTTMN